MEGKQDQGFTYDIGELRFSNQILRLGPDQLLLQDHQLGTLGLLQLQLGDLIGNLRLVVPTRLDALLDVPNGLQDTARVIQGVGIGVLLLADLAENNAHLVRDVRDGIIARLFAPLRQLGCDRNPLAPGSLVGRDEVVLGLDQSVELAGELGLDLSSERGEGELGAGGVRRGRRRVVTVADGEGSIPGECQFGLLRKVWRCRVRRGREYHCVKDIRLLRLSVLVRAMVLGSL